ncbi:unnamed protein product [Callosobruchus maculatus]|uniref:Uncharacterized protein n=1 Tax=Callosobruchus maculatus TaxID=64391 RepID=A0A653BY02_CALMS|nr:unnamed protein product [Callosobruchus maculatus]
MIVIIQFISMVIFSQSHLRTIALIRMLSEKMQNLLSRYTPADTTLDATGYLIVTFNKIIGIIHYFTIEKSQVLEKKNSFSELRFFRQTFIDEYSSENTGCDKYMFEGIILKQCDSPEK